MEKTPKPTPQKLKNPEDVRYRRDQVLSKYQGFKEAARQRREKLEAAKKFQQFKRDASELEAWINEKIHIVSNDSYKDRTNLQVCSTVAQLRGVRAVVRLVQKRTSI